MLAIKRSLFRSWLSNRGRLLLGPILSLPNWRTKNTLQMHQVFTQHCKKERYWCTKFLKFIGRSSALDLYCWGCITLYYISVVQIRTMIVGILSLWNIFWCTAKKTINSCKTLWSCPEDINFLKCSWKQFKFTELISKCVLDKKFCKLILINLMTKDGFWWHSICIILVLWSGIVFNVNSINFVFKCYSFLVYFHTTDNLLVIKGNIQFKDYSRKHWNKADNFFLTLLMQCLHNNYLISPCS